MIGTVAHPFYFFHIPKTAGSSLNRLINDSFPEAAAYPAYIPSAGCEDDVANGYGVYRGHMGRLPMTLSRRPMTVVTLLRDPVARAWSHYRFVRWKHGDFLGGQRDTYSFRDFLDDPRWEEPGSDYQSRWLAFEPDVRLFVDHAPDLANYNDPLVHRAPAWPDDVPRTSAEVASRARATLEECALVGTVERIDDFMEALARLLGRRLAPLPRLNVHPDKTPPPSFAAERILASSPADLEMCEIADRRLTDALRELPPVPDDAEPLHVAPVSYTQTMADALLGTGWHARVHTPEAGVHRWSGPQRTSVVELPIRVRGRARIEIDVLSASSDEAWDELAIAVQGRPVEHRFVPATFGRTAVTEAELEPGGPVVLTFDVPHTTYLRGPDGSQSPDPAGIAVGDIRLLPTS